MKLYVFLPCYNEELNIIDLINAWILQVDELLALNYKLEIFCIDDSSKDTTKVKINDMCSKYDYIHLIEHEENKGLCGGLNTAISSFISIGENDSLMVLMDGDNTHNPKYVLSMLDKINRGFDCVIASRYEKFSNVVGVAPHRRFMSDMARYYYRFILKVPNVHDYTCGYRVYTYEIIKRLVEKFGNNPIKEKSFACMMEFLYKLYLVGAEFSEVGFELRYDYKKGASKMKVIKTMLKSLTTALKLRRLRKVINYGN